MLNESPYPQWRADRYATFAEGAGKDFADGKLSLEALAKIGWDNGDVPLTSGRQELYENLINDYL